MRMSRGPEGLASLLSESLRAMNLDMRVREQTVLLVWDEVVGEQVAGAAQPEFVRDGQLFVTTKSSVWANELGFYKTDMINRLNKRVGGPVVKDIVFKVGRVRPRERREVEPEERGLEGITLTEDELEKVEAALSGAGEGAADVLRGSLLALLRLEKWKQAHGWTPCRKCGALQNTASGVCPVCQIE